MVTMKYLSLHENNPMIRLYSVNYSDECIIMELGDTDLRAWNNMNQSTSRRCIIIRSVIESVYLLHQIGIVHGDLKLDNLVLMSYGNVKLIDFGFSGPPVWVFTQYTTPIYKDNYDTNDFSSDIYSLGIILIELFTGDEFVTPPDDDQIIEASRKISKDYRYFIRSMTGDPRKRPNITQIMDKFGMEALTLPSLKMVSIKHGNISQHEKRWIDNLLRICNVAGPHRICDFFTLLSLLTGMNDYRSELQFYGLAVIYIYSSYFHNPVNYPTVISMAPSFYSRANRKRKLASKTDFLINNEQFITKLFSLM